MCFASPSRSDREAAIWDLSEKSLHERHQLMKQQLKDQYFLQRHQLLKKHEKVMTPQGSSSAAQKHVLFRDWSWENTRGTLLT